MADISLYRYSLVAALSLMVFFSVTFIFGSRPSSSTYRHYACARRRMGLALLVLSGNYAVHLFAEPRFGSLEWAIMMNIDTYFIAAWLFGSSMLQLLAHDFNSPRRDVRNVVAWAAFSAIGATLLHFAPRGWCTVAVLMAASLAFMSYTLRIALRLVAAYKRAVRLLDSYHSDDVAAYVRWVSVFTWLAVFYGIGQGVFTFIPDRYVFLWILSSIPFYCYGYVSYINYALEVSKVDEALEADASAAAHADAAGTPHEARVVERNAADAAESESVQRLEEWIRQGGFTRQGLTIVQLSQEVCTNRTYLSSYINNRYGMTFRDWINSLRMDYAKNLMKTEPELTIMDVAQRAGYMSLSNFTRLFTASEGTSPGRWRKENAAVR